MRRARLGFLLSVLVLGALLVPAGTAAATRPIPVNATLEIRSAMPTSPPLVADGNVILTTTSTGDLTGDLVGTLAWDLRILVHPNGMGNYHGSGTFTGTVGDRSGTAVIGIQGTFDLATGQQRGQWEVRTGTDGLAALHIQGSFEGPLGGPISLSGLMHFDP